MKLKIQPVTLEVKRNVEVMESELLVKEAKELCLATASEVNLDDKELTDELLTANTVSDSK